MAGYAQPSDNLYVADLPADLNDDLVKQIFGAYGQVQSCRVLPPKAPGQMTAALIRFASTAEATWIVDNLNGNIPEGMTTPVVVRYANNPQGQGGGGYGKAGGKGDDWGGKGGDSWGKGKRSEPYGGGKGKGGWGKGAGCDIKTLKKGVKGAGVLPGTGGSPSECCLYIKNLPTDTADVDIYELFSPFGAIAPKGVKAMTGQDGACTGIGFVDYVDPECAAAAVMTLNGTMMPDGTVLTVQVKAPKKGGKGKDA
mmetsp:Transcript_52401/g.135225  ORF Transcript_52401/g.135225 Transcript_52401/m.135225 type:complete len:254 (+) Transcript_52401:92-853(+)